MSAFLKELRDEIYEKYSVGSATKLSETWKKPAQNFKRRYK